MTEEMTENEIEFRRAIIDHQNGSTAKLIKARRDYVKTLAARARRGERVGRDAINKARHALSETTFIYFIVCGSGRAVKIGKSNDVALRLSELQVANHDDLKLIASFAATHEMERVVHRALADHRIRGEWFKCSDEVLTVAEAAVDGGVDLVLEAISKILRKKLEVDVQAS